MRPLMILALLATATASPAFAQKLGETIDVGSWKVAMSANKDGSTGCTASITYDDKSAIAFGVDNDDTHMFIVSEPTAKMAAGSQTNLSYKIDTGKPFTGVGVAASATLLAVPIQEADLDAVYAAFQKGDSLFISLGDQDFEEPLEGSSNAISALADCQAKLPPRKK